MIKKHFLSIYEIYQAPLCHSQGKYKYVKQDAQITRDCLCPVSCHKAKF